MDVRLPAHVEVASLLRRVSAAGGFATVLRKGERDAGTILIVLTNSGREQRLYERMPTVVGSRTWQCTRRAEPEKANEFNDYIDRRGLQDADTWIIELDIADGERFILEQASG